MLILLSLLTACDLMSVFETNDDRINKANNIPVAEQARIAKDKSLDDDEYGYNPNNKRDPFQSFLLSGSSSPLVDNIPRTPLQKYEVGQYILTGIIWGIDRPRALVEDPSGDGHVVEIGTYIGTKWGKVETIEEGVVTITEELQTVDEQLVVRKQELRLMDTSNGGVQ